MSETLSDFLIDLASDPARLASFAANPEGVLAQTMLTAEERSALLAGESEGLRMALATGLAAARKGGKKPSGKKKKNGGGGIKKAKSKKKKKKNGGGGVKMARH